MKIAILADPLDNQNAGVHSYTKGMVEALVDFDNENEYLLIRQQKDSTLPERIRQITVPNFTYLPGFASFRLFFIIPMLLRWHRVDIVLEPAHFGPFNLPRSVKRITVIHDLTPLMFPHYHPWIGGLLQRLFLKRILQKTDLILAVSKNTADDLATTFPFTTDKTSVIYPGRDPFFRPEFSDAVLRKWKLSAPYFLCVGTIEPRKNLLLLLKAYQQFRIKHKDRVMLLLVGGRGWKYEVFYEELAVHPFREDILLTGYVEKQDLPALYTHALATIYPSYYEGFGLPVLEAMTCGGVVISSDQASLPEVAGDAALYFHPEDVKGLLQHMLTITQRKDLGEEIRNQSLQQAAGFSWEAYWLQFSELIHS
ncbi:MAG: glycosyltransferase family 4 protein [Saprospiraceae bacterium]|nr:glycosyltransferase family 4 protein [Saprospiraceae bacterium]